MNFYRSLHDIPELAALPPQERAVAWRKAQGHNLIFWQTWASLAAACLCAGIGEYFGELAGFPHLGLALGGVVGAFVFWQSGFHLARHQYLASLARAEKIAKKKSKPR